MVLYSRLLFSVPIGKSARETEDPPISRVRVPARRDGNNMDLAVAADRPTLPHLWMVRLVEMLQVDQRWPCRGP